jgi:hypothetical protein
LTRRRNHEITREATIFFNARADDLTAKTRLGAVDHASS